MPFSKFDLSWDWYHFMAPSPSHRFWVDSPRGSNFQWWSWGIDFSDLVSIGRPKTQKVRKFLKKLNFSVFLFLSLKLYLNTFHRVFALPPPWDKVPQGRGTTPASEPGFFSIFFRDFRVSQWGLVSRRNFLFEKVAFSSRIPKKSPSIENFRKKNEFWSQNFRKKSCPYSSRILVVFQKVAVSPPPLTKSHKVEGPHLHPEPGFFSIFFRDTLRTEYR